MFEWRLYWRAGRLTGENGGFRPGQFHRDGLIGAADDVLKPEMLDYAKLVKKDNSSRAKAVEKAVKSAKLSAKDEIAETKRKFSDLCQELVAAMMSEKVRRNSQDWPKIWASCRPESRSG